MNCRYALLALLLAQSGFLAAQQSPEPLHAPLSLIAAVQDKNFFLLSLIERTPAASAAIESDAELKSLAQAKRDALHKAATTCEIDVECLTAALRLSEAEVSQAAGALRRAYQRSEPVREMIDGDLRRSGTYVRYQAKSGDELLAAAWLDAAHGINNIVDVYGSGKAPRSPNIDAVSFDVKSQGYGQMIHTVTANLDERIGAVSLFFEPSLQFALSLLQINNRDESGRHEPLEVKENAAAWHRIASIAWKTFPYSVIVVPGSGPDRLAWSLSPISRLRVEIAARRFKEGKAPLILVSGGYVHPNQTPYSEAIEMKKSLIDEFGVPADAIIIDPHARHTTTNLRNAARLIYRYGIPFNRKGLITTDEFQLTYIESDAFSTRCEQELSYQPATILGRVSIFDLEFTPRRDSLQIDAMDPLDP